MSDPSPKSSSTGPSSVELFGRSFFDGTAEQALETLLTSSAAQPTRAYFMAAYCVNAAASSEPYRQALTRADVLFADGAGMALAAVVAGHRLRANINGTDLCPQLIERLAEGGRSVYLLGAEPGVAQEVADRWRAEHPRLVVAGTRDGYFDEAESPAIAEAVRQSSADTLLVALGVPAQELWLDRWFPATGARLAMGVGGLFDFVAERVTRAPRALRGLGLEWAWRTAQEPRRLAGRYLVGNPLFLGRLAAWEAGWWAGITPREAPPAGPVAAGDAPGTERPTAGEGSSPGTPGPPGRGADSG